MAVAAGNGGDGPEEGVGESSSPPHDPAPAPVPAPAASGGSGGGVRGGGLRDICREVFERLVNDGYLAGSELLAQLEALFNRLPMSHKLDVNIDKAEDVLIHQKVLAEAKDPDRRPAFAVRFLRLEEVNVDETTNSGAHEEGADIGEALSTRYDGCMLEVSRTKGFPLSTSKNPNSVLPSPSMMQKIHKVTKVLPDFNPDTKDALINNTRRMALQPLKICDEDEDDSGNEFLSSSKLPKSGNCTTHIDDELVPKNSKKFCFDNLDDGCLLEVSGTKGSLLSTSKNPNSMLPSPSMMQKIHKVFSDEEIEDILSQWINNPHYLLPSNVYSFDIYTKECFEELEQYSTDGVTYFVVHLKHMRNGFNRKMANSLYSWKQANVYTRERSILKIMKYAEGKTYVRYRCMKEYTMKGGPENIVFCEISSHEWRDGRKDQDLGAQDPGAHDPGAHGLSDIRRKDLGAHAPALSVRFHLTSGGMEGRTRRTLVHKTLVHMTLVHMALVI